MEEQEAINYEKRMKKGWVDAVAPMVNKLHTDGVRKEYLTEAPYIVVMMKEAWQVPSMRHASAGRCPLGGQREDSSGGLGALGGL